MAFLGFKSAKEKDMERKKKLAALVETQQQPPGKVDKKFRPLDPKRTEYGYRGYDPSKEPMVGYEAKQQGQQILKEKGITPEELKRKVAATKKKKAK